jgi:ribokinase
MSKVHVLGSMNMDLVARVEQFPRPGETLFGHDFQTLPGGKGLNQAVAAARAGASVVMRGAVGADAQGSSLRDFLVHEGIDIQGVSTAAGVATGTALILVDGKGENSIVVVPGANEQISESVDARQPVRGDFLLAPFEVPDVAIEPAFARARAAGACTVLNPAPARPCRPAILEQTDLLVVNETELQFFAGFSGGAGGQGEARTAVGEPLTRERIVEWVERLAVGHPLGVVATLGGKGLIASLGGRLVELPAREVDVVDTTAAGDTFVGALAAGMAGGASVEESLQFAVAAAGICVSRAGAAPSIPELSEIRAIL